MDDDQEDGYEASEGGEESEEIESDADEEEVTNDHYRHSHKQRQLLLL